MYQTKFATFFFIFVGKAQFYIKQENRRKIVDISKRHIHQSGLAILTGT